MTHMAPDTPTGGAQPYPKYVKVKSYRIPQVPNGTRARIRWSGGTATGKAGGGRVIFRSLHNRRLKYGTTLTITLTNNLYFPCRLKDRVAKNRRVALADNWHELVSQDC